MKLVEAQFESEELKSTVVKLEAEQKAALELRNQLEEAETKLMKAQGEVANTNKLLEDAMAGKDWQESKLSQVESVALATQNDLEAKLEEALSKKQQLEISLEASTKECTSAQDELAGKTEEMSKMEQHICQSL